MHSEEKETPKVNQGFKFKTRHNDVSSIYNKHLRTVRQTKSIVMSARCTVIKAKSVKHTTSNSKSPAQKRPQWLSDVPHLITARKQRKGEQADTLTSFFGHHPTNRNTCPGTELESTCEDVNCYFRAHDNLHYLKTK